MTTHSAINHNNDNSAGRWPVPVSSLSALVDLGMSDERIGRYYAVNPAAITRLRVKHQLPWTRD